MDNGAQIGLIVGCIGGVIVLAAIAFLLYKFLISKYLYKRQIKEMSRTFSYYDALLVGQDSQYVHRLEIISHTNLLYVEKYENFSKKFKEIFDNDDKYAESMIKQVKNLISNNQYHHIKSTLDVTKSAVENFSNKVIELDKQLHELISLEENARYSVLKLKEKYRVVKQTFYVCTNDIEMVSSSYTKVFDKLDKLFAEIENHIEGAEYDEIDHKLPLIEKVISALGSTLSEMPNICATLENIIPNKIENVKEAYKQVEAEGIPLYHLSFNSTLDEWYKTIENLKEKAANLDINQLLEGCNQIQNQIDEFNTTLYKEREDKKIFEDISEKTYKNVLDIENKFLKLCSHLPTIKEVFIIKNDEITNFEELKKNVDSLGSSKRMLDSFLHSGTTQPYSILMTRLNDVNDNYEQVTTGLTNFMTYLESLKSSAEEANDLIFSYYYRCKQVENKLYSMHVKEVYNQRIEQLNSVYDVLNDIYTLLNNKPIDVEKVKDQMESLKNFANVLFDEIEAKYDEQQLAETAILYANRDRYHQIDVDQQLSQLEQVFYKGDFAKVYNDATMIYRRNHAEENHDAK